ncbi:hypothetical protein LEP1GSC050_2530 [Leptospira broomii serovar Hurstbridge str. 5399]|uniref:Uncharacterized protein n=1 Tax=Leptospira broomii serovar Hurstbridge str. 5399 TaxID=1049789 RepID=T0GBY9_9LEPT|nr:hypothetical protein LEP1GSC050_2530 [Leptospira broomii serovar Hurstbridge str. 5399]
MFRRVFKTGELGKKKGRSVRLLPIGALMIRFRPFFES